VVETPNANCASSGTVVTIPVPFTVIERGGAAVAAAATARVATSVRKIAIRTLIVYPLPYAAVGTCVTDPGFGSEARGKHAPDTVLT
jgi:hypothetical protein